jgi:hypothetical protein
MNDLIIHIFKYFAKFVPKEVLKSIFIQPDGSRKTGYSEIESEILAQSNDSVINDIEKFVVSINENFISERIKNSHGFILFVEYGKLHVDHDIEKGLIQSLAVTIAYNFSASNNDNLNEIIHMNGCLEILDKILRQMGEEQEELGFCATAELITYPAEIQVVDPMSFYGCGGWCAMFTNANTIL